MRYLILLCVLLISCSDKPKEPPRVGHLVEIITGTFRGCKGILENNTSLGFFVSSPVCPFYSKDKLGAILLADPWLTRVKEIEQ